MAPNGAEALEPFRALGAQPHFPVAQSEVMIERDTINESELQSLLREVRKTLPGSLGRTDVSLERKREIVLDTILSRLREFFGVRRGLGVPRSSGEANSHFQNVYNEIVRLVRAKGQFRAEPYVDAFLEEVFQRKNK